MENFLLTWLYNFITALVLVGAILLIQSGKLDNDIGKIAFGIIGLFFAGMLSYFLIINPPFTSIGKPYTHEAELKDGSIVEANDVIKRKIRVSAQLKVEIKRL